ncbi:calmodulin-like protein 7 [Cucumis melo]|uniref:Calmodulin-like protein 7 n=2 Tax=Cucumis melo TaxID=3656 RepID=A0A1S3C5X4_CUCME|nr:calmodulin-like protein 7 [Cucumis melo]
MEPIFNFLLLSVLFVAGFVNFLLYFPTKRFTAWFQSIKPSSQIPHFKSTSLQPPPPPPPSPPPPPPSAMELKKVFGTFDKNDDGFITKKELMESLKSMRMMITEKDAEEMLKEVDENGDGLIDFEEFCVLGEKLLMGFEENKKTSVGDDEEGLKDAFGVFDKDSDGLISVEELSLVLCSLGMNEGKIVENCKEMIRKVDLDGDGMVNFDEFKKMMRNGVSILTSS